MEYRMKAGVLYREQAAEPLAQIRSSLSSRDKQIFAPDGTLLLRTEVRSSGEGRPLPGRREYRMLLPDGRLYAAASPQYAGGADPGAAERPVCGMPRADHAVLTREGCRYTLWMQNEQNYLLQDAQRQTAAQVLHRGLAGGWKIAAQEDLPAGFLCGLFVFCRYLERESEWADG